MNCPIQKRENAELLLEYSARTLDPARAALLEQHLEACAECRKVIEEQKAVWDALDAWRPEQVSAEFDQRLYEQIERERASSGWAAWWRRWMQPAAPISWKPAFPLAVAAVVLLAAVLIRVPQVPDVPPGQNAVDIEQVEQALEDLEMLTPVYASPSNEAI